MEILTVLPIILFSVVCLKGNMDTLTGLPFILVSYIYDTNYVKVCCVVQSISALPLGVKFHCRFLCQRMFWHG